MLEIQTFLQQILQTVGVEWLLVNEKIMLIVNLDED